MSELLELLAGLIDAFRDRGDEFGGIMLVPSIAGQMGEETETQSGH